MSARRRQAGTTRGDRGSATVWVVAVAALVLAVGVAVTVRTLAVLARHRAQDAADLVALAAATGIGTRPDPCAAGASVAAANGVTLDHCVVSLAADGRSGTVRVTVGASVRLPIVGPAAVRAGARAGRDPP